MPRRGENIYKRKDGRWEGRFIIARDISGKAKYKSVYAACYKEVKNKLIEAKQNTVANTYHDYQEYELSIFCEEWLKQHQKDIKESSYIKYYNIVFLYIIPYLGEIKLKDLSLQIIHQYSNELLTHGSQKNKGLSTKSVSDIISVFKSIMKYIVYHYGYVHFDFHQIIIKQNKETNMRILTFQEEQRLYKYIYEHQTLVNLSILLVLFTGIRIGELCALRWDNIHLQEGILTINRTMQRIQTKNHNEEKKTKIIITIPKSQSSIRQIPIPQYLVKLLQPYEGYENEYFLTGQIDKYIEPRSLENKFKDLMSKNMIENINFHALRHTFATKCIEIGFDVKCLSEILGHSNVNITLNKYVHPSFSLKQDYMNKLNQLINV